MPRIEIYIDVAGKFRWRLVAGNGEKVAASEAYVSKQGAVRSAQHVQAWASAARIVDLTV